MTNRELIIKASTAESAEALSALCVPAKTAAGREEINSLLAVCGRDVLGKAVASPEAKTRKNAYRLIGALRYEADLPLLEKALREETTLFTVPSLLLAIGALGGEEILKNYEPPVSDGEAMDKHVAEITLARKKALQSLEKEEELPERIEKLPAPRLVYAYSPEGFAPLLKEELDSLGFDTEPGDGFVSLTTDDVAGLYRAARMTEALFPVKKNVPLTPDDIASAVGTMPEEPYRIELRGYTKDRRKLINALAFKLGGENNPSGYLWELRLDCRMDTADVYWKLFYPGDGRYPWRRRALPASMHPATAACVAAYALKQTKKTRPRVLDPFCGSGSLLFSLEELASCRVLIGVDKSSSAVEAARENARAVSSKASFVTKDILRFDGGEGFDLIVSNMPFGNRVGTHDSNIDLYRRFIRKLPFMLAPGGTAVLYTMEYKLLQSCLKDLRGLKLREKKRTEAGGLLPWIFVIDKD